MSKKAETRVQSLLDDLKERHPDQPEFHEAVAGVARSVMPLVLENSAYDDCKVLEQLTEPDRIISFRVAWRDDDGAVHVNRGWRVQHNHAIGPYKGGLRFAPHVNESVLKFLAFEQTFKNALTNLPMGGAKGGSDFDPHGRSNGEIMRFCQAFMECLYRYIGPNTDVPAGDMGVGGREIGFLFGHFIRLTNTFEGSLTGKGLAFGGSAERTEATGYGLIYFLENALNHHDLELKEQTVAISGAGNVALYAAEKAMEEGAKVVTLSDSGGLLHVKEGLDEDTLDAIKRCKLKKHGALEDGAGDIKGAKFHKDKTPWGVECDIALPCATQNELDGDAAKTLIDNGVKAIAEGANMPCTEEAREAFRKSDVIFVPGKAANAGGVAVSGLEISQNAVGLQWDREEVDQRLRRIMSEIHDKCRDACPDKDCKPLDYVAGSDIAGFKRVADAIVAYGVG
ncbi:NADP-specific glutamate dehydrogenase [Euryhalocaulis caribicus]|uniref:NADP-specific glutamate dehydrogenase n=1 Tax=Euryhalocaulis caribicus TaxID=1161401 RepID=UPI0003A0510F|nr:NADP-specific glutamate dehydrogenase [Euryhalocaulis caribicus]